MTPFHLLATTAESHSHSILDAFPHMAGMVMVMVSLAFLWGVCACTAKIVSIAFPAKQLSEPVAGTTAPATAKTSVPATAIPDESRIAPEIVAVIAAAVATVSGNQPVRIVSIKPMSTSWERAGRQSVLTSHRIR